MGKKASLVLPCSPAPQPSATPLLEALGSVPVPPWGSASHLHTCDSLLGSSDLNRRTSKALWIPLALPYISFHHPVPGPCFCSGAASLALDLAFQGRLSLHPAQVSFGV